MPEASTTRRSARATRNLLPAYYLLAAFGVATMATSLYLNHRIMAIYTESVADNQRWAQRLIGYSELDPLAADVNAPGNDVFVSRDVSAEAAAMRRALSRFNETFATLREDLRANVDARRAAPFMQDFEAVEAAMNQMVDEGTQLFAHLARNESALAEERMASMDRKFDLVDAVLAHLRTRVISIQKEHLDDEIRAAAKLQKLEYLVGVLVALMVGGATAYGTKLARRESAHERQTQRHIEGLRDAEARTRSILDTAADGIVTVDEHGVVESANRAAEVMFGYPATEMIGRNYRSLVTPSAEGAARADGDGIDVSRPDDPVGEPSEFAGRRSEVMGHRKDGAVFPMDLAVSEMLVERRRMFTAVVRDTTERKRADEQLRGSREQLRDLAAHVESLQEEERSRIAREIHDELGQMLTGLKMRLLWLGGKLADDAIVLREKVTAMCTIIDTTIQSVRRIATELRPPMLDEIGLVAAVEWQAQEFQAHSGIRCRCSFDLVYFEPDRALSTALFRIFQEALTNVARHAGATEVSISLTDEADYVVLLVGDNGRGITEQNINDRKSLGLLGMRERARLLGGDVTIVGRPGEGTVVTVTIPYRASTGSRTPDP
jgi:PAS domain S-box-containing protein